MEIGKTRNFVQTRRGLNCLSGVVNNSLSVGSFCDCFSAFRSKFVYTSFLK